MEVWCYSKLLRVRWIDKVSTDEIQTRVGEEKSFGQNIVKLGLNVLAVLCVTTVLVKTI